MANVRMAARFITEAAPPQFVNVTRQRASKVLDTIKEDDKEKEVAANDYFYTSSKNAASTMSMKRTTSTTKGNDSYVKGVLVRRFALFGKK